MGGTLFGKKIFNGWAVLSMCIYLSPVCLCLTVYLSVCLPVCLSHLFLSVTDANQTAPLCPRETGRPCVYLSLSTSLSVSLSTCMSSSMSTCLSVYMFVSLHLPVCVWLCLSVCHQQEAVRRVMGVARQVSLPIFLADPTALSLIGQQGRSEGGASGCNFLCTGRPTTAFAAIADHWKYDVSGLHF